MKPYDSENRKRKGLPELRVSTRGMITTPQEIVQSKKGRELIEKLTKTENI
jgi:hypothetical protein